MTLIEVKTYRMKGHAQHDPQFYVPEEELEAWRSRDPIDRYVEHLRTEGSATEEELTAIDQRIESELDRAVEEAEASPMPEPEAALAAVQAGAPQSPPWARTL
jgi:TPP-dependent pyruvate/acetoin dehydrogenase alpha subunit